MTLKEEILSALPTIIILLLTGLVTYYGVINLDKRHYCTNDIYLIQSESSGKWYSYVDKSDECYECPSGASDIPVSLDGPFNSKEQGCNQYR